MRVLWTLNKLTWHSLNEKRYHKSFMGWNLFTLFPTLVNPGNKDMKTQLRLALSRTGSSSSTIDDRRSLSCTTNCGRWWNQSSSFFLIGYSSSRHYSSKLELLEIKPCQRGSANYRSLAISNSCDAPFVYIKSLPHKSSFLRWLKSI